MKNNVQYILKIALNVIVIGLIIFLSIKIFVFLLPIILIVIIGYYLYLFFFKAKVKTKYSNNKFQNNFKNLKNNIEEAEIIQEKIDK